MENVKLKMTNEELSRALESTSQELSLAQEQLAMLQEQANRLHQDKEMCARPKPGCSRANIAPKLAALMSLMLCFRFQGNVQSNRRAAERETESDEAAGPAQVQWEGMKADPQGTPTPSLIPALLLFPER